MNILIVDDRPLDLKLLRLWLEAAGATVAEAADGVEAINILEHTSVDAIISDIKMPRMNGFRLCQEVRTRPQTSEVPFIAYSAICTSQSDDRRMIESGANQILRKPASASVFAGILHEIAEGKFLPHPAPTPVPLEAELHKLHLEQSVAKLEAKNRRLESSVEQLTLDHQHLGQQLRQAQSMAALGTLAMSIAHDFNNILAAIYQYCELARDEAHGNATLTEHLNGLSRGATRATALVQQIFAFGCKRNDTRRPLELWQVAIEAAGLLRAAVPATIDVQTSFGQDTPDVFANATEIHQILMNLGINAAHAMRALGGRLTITLENCLVDAKLAALHSGLRAGHYARLTVSDTGHGMDEQTLARIFEPFFTTKASGEGTGLGLAIVRDIVRSSNCAITVSSRLGEGTTFRVYFPAHVEISD